MPGIFKINLDSIHSGLDHQKTNLMVLIRYCYKNNLCLVKPTFNLKKDHNNGIPLRSNLSEYFDLDNITVNGKIFKLIDDNEKIKFDVGFKKYDSNLLRKDLFFSELPNLSVEIPYTKQIQSIASEVVSKINGDYMCIHVRRGDRVTNEQIDNDTNPNNVKKIIEKYKAKKIYIMTNKIEELKCLSKSTNYELYFFNNFDILKDIKDNYYLYSIENLIMKNATIKCSTFKTNKNYYDCYLTDHFGNN